MSEIIDSNKSLETVIELLRATFSEFKYLDIDIKIKGKARTNKQNAALHKYFTMLADALNSAGYDMKKTLKPDVDIPWNSDLVKEFMWRPIQKVVIGESSTAKAKAKDYPEIYEVLNRHTAQKLGVSIPWPTIDHQ